MRNGRSILFLFTVIWTHLQAQNYPFRFDCISIEEGLSQSSVLSIAQDRTGFMWFGTYEGLNRYDGYAFKIYTSNALDSLSLSQNVVRSLLVDHEGILWVATEGGLNRYDWEKDVFYRYLHDPGNPSSLIHNRIRNIYEDRSGTLWISTDNGLGRFDREKEQFRNYLYDPDDPYSLSNSRVRCVYEDSHGILWVGTDVGLNCFNEETQKFTHFRNDPADPHSLSNDLVICIREDRAGRLWIGTWGGGLCRYDYHSGRFYKHRNNPNDPGSIGHDIIRAIFQDLDGNLWIGTYGGGLSLYDSSTDRFIQFRHSPNNPSSISSEAIFSLYEDQSGILWIGTEFGGVSRFDKRKSQFHSYFTAAGSSRDIISNSIQAVFCDSYSRDDILWLGTWGGGLIRLNRESMKYQVFRNRSQDPHSIRSDIVRCIAAGDERSLWIGTELGLSRFDRKTLQFDNYVFQTSNEFDQKYDNVFSILEDSRHQLWVGSYYGGLHHFDQNTHLFKRFPAKQDDPSTINDYIVWCIYEDSQKDIWIGTETGGLNRYDPKTRQFKVHKNKSGDSSSISGNKVICIHEDGAGTLWIGTTRGLNRFDRKNETFHTYGTEDGLPHEAIQGIQHDGQGYLWISTTRGISRFDPVSEIFINFTTSDGLPSNEFNVNSCCFDSRSKMMFGTINGMVMFDPKTLHTNQHVPSVEIIDFKIFNESVPIGKSRNGRTILKKSILATDLIKIMYNENVISFDFSALDFTAPEKNQYAYRLEGLETDWNHVGNRHFATYSRIPPGEYTFRVKGSNNNKVWNETGRSVRIIVRPAFWSTLGFKLGTGILLIGLFLALHRLRMVDVQKRNMQLQEINRKLNDEIHEREQAEAKVQASLVEKEVLLKEIHHRVKNNMQIICSLLNLQSNRIQEPELKSLFVESQNRVRAMALIHERLYKTKDLNNINFQRYVSDLANDLLTSYTGTTNFIKMEMEIDPIRLQINKAVPCGLVINELVSNAIKYAFPPEHEGERKILIKMIHEKGHYVLTVRDNGIGMPDIRKDENEESLGLKLVDILVQQQLRGELSWEVNQGTQFNIRFGEK